MVFLRRISVPPYRLAPHCILDRASCFTLLKADRRLDGRIASGFPRPSPCGMAPSFCRGKSSRHARCLGPLVAGDENHLDPDGCAFRVGDDHGGLVDRSAFGKRLYRNRARGCVFIAAFPPAACKRACGSHHTDAGIRFGGGRTVGSCRIFSALADGFRGVAGNPGTIHPGDHLPPRRKNRRLPHGISHSAWCSSHPRSRPSAGTKQGCRTIAYHPPAELSSSPGSSPHHGEHPDRKPPVPAAVPRPGICRDGGIVSCFPDRSSSGLATLPASPADASRGIPQTASPDCPVLGRWIVQRRPAEWEYSFPLPLPYRPGCECEYSVIRTEMTRLPIRSVRVKASIPS